jgi:spore coat protein U-like protein
LKKLINSILLLGAVLLAGNGCLHAQCSVSTIGVSYGSYSPLSVTPADSTGSVNILCNANIKVTIAIGPSPNSGGFNPRRLRKATGADFLNYNLYTNSSRATIWGNGTQGTAIVNINARRNRTSNVPVYGRAPAGQDIGTGAYSESLVVTINF